MISAASLCQDKVLGEGGHTGGGGDIVSLDVFYLWKNCSLIFIFPNDMPDNTVDHHIRGIHFFFFPICGQHIKFSISTFSGLVLLSP